MSSSESEDGEVGSSTPQGEGDISPQDQLLRALYKGDLEEFREMLKNKDVNPYHYYPRRGTCLEIACRICGRGQFVQALLKKVKPSFNSIVPEPIHHAAKLGVHDAMAELLRDKRTDVNAVTSKGDTALHYLAKHYKPDDGYKKCMELLLCRQDIDINKPNKKGFIPIHQAAFYDRKEMVQLILERYRKDLDLDCNTGSGRTARTFLALKYPDVVPTLPPIKYNTSRGYENQLLAAFNNHHFEVFRGLLRQFDEDGNPLFDPNFRYGRPLNETCLDMACRQEGYQEYMKVLLEAGADPNNVNKTNYKAPIHVAAEALNYEALETLLKHPGTNVSAVDKDGWSALHYATRQNSQQWSNSEKCIKLLLKKVKVKNVDDLIDLAISNGNTKALELYKNLNPEENIPTYVFDELFEYLRNLESAKFISQFNYVIKNHEELIKHRSRDIMGFLEIAVDLDLMDIVQTLLEHASNPQFFNPPPLVSAANKQNYKMLTVLLNEPNVDVDATDMKGDTALHHAVNACNFECIITLLNRGASIHKENVLGKTPLPMNKLKVLLDNCLKTNDKYCPQQEDYEVIFDYTLLTASKTEYVTVNSEPERTLPHQEVNHVTNVNVPETQEDEKIELDLLVVQTNAAITAETTDKSSNNQNQTQDTGVEDIITGVKVETELLYYLGKNSIEYGELLDHPIISSYINFKWDCVKYFFYTNVFIYISFFIVLNCYIMFSPEVNGNFTEVNKSLESNEPNFRNSDYSILCYNFWISLIFLTTLISLRELFQLCMSSDKLLFYICGFRVNIIPGYFKNGENYLDLAILGISWSIIFLPNDNYYSSTLNVFGILFSSCELILLLGRWPIFSRNIEMLKSVTITYCWLFLTFLCIILAFAHCLYIVFRRNMQHDSIPTVLWAVCRTMILMTGEYEANDLDFESMPYASIIVFLLFVFFISIVLLNLLIGLSVNNTKVIEDGSKVVCLTSRIYVIYDIESAIVKLYKTCKQCFPNCKFLDLFIESVLLFPKTRHEKLVKTLQNRGGMIEIDPFFHSKLRERIRFISFLTNNLLRCIICRQLITWKEIKISKMEKTVLDKAVRIISRGTAWNETEEKERSTVDKSGMEMLGSLNYISIL